MFELYGEENFVLTCISTGGPATTIYWSRNVASLVTSNETVIESALTNRETGQYTHTLRVSVRQEGLYTCNVTNAVSKNSSATLNVKGRHFS